MNQFTVITGVSGSGKSTLAFDILFNEGQRRYLLTLSSHAKSIIQNSRKTNIGKVINLPPTIAIKQHKGLGNYKSTVSNISEIHNFLRLIYAKLGEQHCHICKTFIRTHTVDQITVKILQDNYNQNIIVFSPISIKNLKNHIEKKDTTPFFLNNKLITQQKLRILNLSDDIIIEKLIGNIIVKNEKEEELRELVNIAVKTSDGFIKVISIKNTNIHVIDIESISDILIQQKTNEKFFNAKLACLNCNTILPTLEPLLFSHNSKNGCCPICKGTGINITNKNNKESSEDISLCNKCNGKRLNEEALSVYWKGYNIADILSMSVDRAIDFFENVQISSRESLIAKDILLEILSKLNFMKKVGLDYLELNQPEPTLSGGE
ncbi:hypothetical protein [Candidatus Kinetoplastidibacterium blastocrithidiae]|uniref:hypothetical protein n=1 Tax=Candidatus Kinetoplastidibacterium blastocrithidiae TaxID=233181 RepID=UPI0002A66EF4|nr:hypothetical protein [Candidatus Kinetoplastibacterium blastocrithidii]AFZ83853.1 hypothetical protein CKBE_00663 [Candidatus Kinetoplastibacterium blastocrithidii (ex Strigomonas culicis)]